VRNLFAAIRFITILPAGRSDHFDPARMIPLFPVVGLMIGLGLTLADRLFNRLWADPVAAVLDVIFLAAVSGALHLDGLADTADGLYGNHNTRRALEIMKDSRVGAMGVIAVVCCLSLKWAAISSLIEHRTLSLIVVPAYARAAILFGIRWLPYGRTEGGLGSAFFEKQLSLPDFWGMIILIGLSCWMGWKGLLINAVFGLLVSGLLFFFRKKIGGITGDMLGAMTEICETGLFLAAALSLRSLI
jgi:adenosylcobinamide-GDP ribazoletransferase